jgi:ferritin-like metal-binding protein YciE
MKTSERLHDYTNRFFKNHNTCVGVRDRKIFEKIHESGATTVTSLMEVMKKLIDTDEALVNQFDSDAKRDAGTSAAAIDLGSKLRK